MDRQALRAPEERGDENTSAGSAQELIKQGFAQVYALEGGWNEWKEAGFPTEPV